MNDRTNEILNGGNAFPLGVDYYKDVVHHPQRGMTLREYYIGQALAGICANPSEEWYGAKPSDMADAAVTVADAAIKARRA